jgi:hypothetical protein
VAFELKHDDGSSWTAKQFIDVVLEAYKAIYEQEDSNPGNIPLMGSASNGPYGIWGHGIGDLCLEGASKKEGSDVWDLIIGS